MLSLLSVLTLGLLFLIWRIGRQTYGYYQCIEDDLLEDFHHRRLRKQGPDYKRVVNHLVHCENCRDRLSQLQQGKPLEDHLIE